MPPQLRPGRAEPQGAGGAPLWALAERLGLSSPWLPHPRLGSLPRASCHPAHVSGGGAEGRPRSTGGQVLERSKHQPSHPFRRPLFPRNKRRQRKHTWNLNLVKFAELGVSLGQDPVKIASGDSGQESRERGGRRRCEISLFPASYYGDCCL